MLLVRSSERKRFAAILWRIRVKEISFDPDKSKPSGQRDLRGLDPYIYQGHGGVWTVWKPWARMYGIYDVFLAECYYGKRSGSDILDEQPKENSICYFENLIWAQSDSAEE